MIKNILFDYNGIFGPDSDNWESYKDFVNKTGLTSREIAEIWKIYWPTISVGKENLINFIKEVATKSSNSISPEELLEAYLNGMIVYKDILDFAKELKERGFKLIALSNGTNEERIYKVEKFKLKEVFKEFYDSASIGMTKRNPEAFKLIIKRENIKPGETLFVDDREHNVDMARSLGMKGILYKNFSRFKKEVSGYLN